MLGQLQLIRAFEETVLELAPRHRRDPDRAAPHAGRDPRPGGGYGKGRGGSIHLQWLEARGSLSDIIRAIADLANRAGQGRLRQPELEGGLFAVSNLGMYGIERFAAIINPPQAGILAVGAATRQPVVAEDGSLAAATSVTLSGDHRVWDGAFAVQWLGALKNRLEDPLCILM